MPLILVDTCVFTKLQGVYEKTLDCIMSTSDVIGWSKEIMDEYEGRAYPSLLLLRAFIQDLKNKGKWRYFNRSFINSSFRRHENVRTVHYPNHYPDRKWVIAAIAIKARYVISTNDHLLTVPPNRSDGDLVETVNPDEYVALRCPARNQSIHH